MHIYLFEYLRWRQIYKKYLLMVSKVIKRKTIKRTIWTSESSVQSQNWNSFNVTISIPALSFYLSVVTTKGHGSWGQFIYAILCPLFRRKWYIMHDIHCTWMLDQPVACPMTARCSCMCLSVHSVSMDATSTRTPSTPAARKSAWTPSLRSEFIPLYTISFLNPSKFTVLINNIL